MRGPLTSIVSIGALWKFGSDVADGPQDMPGAEITGCINISSQSGLLNRSMFLANVDRTARCKAHRETPVSLVLVIDLGAKMERPARRARRHERFVEPPIATLVIVKSRARPVCERFLGL